MKYELVALCGGGIRSKRGAVLWLDTDKPVHELYAFDERSNTISREVYIIINRVHDDSIDARDSAATTRAAYSGTKPPRKDLTREEARRVYAYSIAYSRDMRAGRGRE